MLFDYDLSTEIMGIGDQSFRLHGSKNNTLTDIFPVPEPQTRGLNGSIGLLGIIAQHRFKKMAF